MNMTYIVTLMGVSATTYFTRALPFIIFNDRNRIPEMIKRLGDVLPIGIVGVLIIYCLKDTPLFTGGSMLSGNDEVVGITVVIVSYLLKDDPRISIGLGTIVYVIMKNLV